MNVEWLRDKAIVREQPFTSTMPILGRLISRVRTMWNNVATTWYIRPILQQQNEFNQVIVQQLEHLSHQLQVLHVQTQEQMEDLNERLTAQDREQSRLIHDTAEIATHLTQMNRLLQTIDERLARLETASHQ